MEPSEFLDRLESRLVPHDYHKRITKGVPDAWRLFRKGSYLFAAVPYSEVPDGDFCNSYVKSEVRKIVWALPVIAEKGLFLLHYGPSGEWQANKELHKVDKTALRPIIMQSIHYVDPNSGANYNSRTAWGPIKFGFCGNVIEKIEQLLAESNGPAV